MKLFKACLYLSVSMIGVMFATIAFADLIFQIDSKAVNVTNSIWTLESKRAIFVDIFLMIVSFYSAIYTQMKADKSVRPE